MLVMAKGKAKPVAPVVKRLTAHRKKLGLSQPAFAKQLGIPLATLRNWEQGRTWPDNTVSRFIDLYLSEN